MDMTQGGGRFRGDRDRDNTGTYTIMSERCPRLVLDKEYE